MRRAAAVIESSRGKAAKRFRNAARVGILFLSLTLDAPRFRMLTGSIRNQIDQIWNTFWTGGITNPLEVIEQITYLLFLKRLDDLQTLEENKAATNGWSSPNRWRLSPRSSIPRARAPSVSTCSC